MSGEILVGGCLLLGFLTRLSAFVALFMLINYYLGPGMARGGAMIAQQQTFIVALIIFYSPPRPRAGVGWAYFSRRQRCKMKLQGSATVEGTRRYRKRFEGNIRPDIFANLKDCGSHPLASALIWAITMRRPTSSTTMRSSAPSNRAAMSSTPRSITVAKCSERSIGTALKQLRLGIQLLRDRRSVRRWFYSLRCRPAKRHAELF